MIRRQILYGILSIAVILITIFSRLNNWPGNDKILFPGLIILIIIIIVLVIKNKGQRFISIFSGLIWICLTILIVGITFKTLNYSKTLFPTYQLGKILNTIKVDYQSFDWVITDPEKQNINPKVIDTMLIEKLEKLHYPLSLLIVKQGSLITEKYFNGADSKTAFNIQSATKSIVGILTGIAIDKGNIQGETTEINKLIPLYFNPETEPLKNDITVKHLLTMQAGWDANERTPTEQIEGI